MLVAASACTKMATDNNNITPPAHDITIVVNAPSQGANAFAPSNLAISFATQKKVVWFNNDFTAGGYGGGGGTTHHLVSDDGTTFDSNTLAPRGLFTATFTTTGVFTYHCMIHPQMVGTVTVNP